MNSLKDPSISSVLEGQLNLGSSMGGGSSNGSAYVPEKKAFVCYDWSWAANVPCWHGSYEDCRRIKKLRAGQTCAFKHT